LTFDKDSDKVGKNKGRKMKNMVKDFKGTGKVLRELDGLAKFMADEGNVTAADLFNRATKMVETALIYATYCGTKNTKNIS
jgi:hypothetical protein